jgi:hypothetical protein
MIYYLVYLELGLQGHMAKKAATRSFLVDYGQESSNRKSTREELISYNQGYFYNLTWHEITKLSIVITDRFLSNSSQLERILI